MHFPWHLCQPLATASPALVFGKPATPRVPQQRPSVSVDWEDSDSSVDSVHSSPSGSSGEPDWPSSTGYQVHSTALCYTLPCHS